MRPTHSASCAIALLATGCFNSANLPADAGVLVPCNDLSSGTALVTTTSAGATSAPVPSGGELGAGLYRLVSSIYYPSTACAIANVATRLRSNPATATTGTIDIATSTASADTLSETVSYTASGASLSVRIDCIAPDPTGLRGNSSQISFSAGGTAIQLFKSTASCGTSVDTYALEDDVDAGSDGS
jgi:hypothetical protein